MKRVSAIMLGLIVVTAATAVRSRAAIQGDYVEVRSADVYTGPCFANSQVGLEGNEALMAWKVREGAWHGVQLDGLSVVAVVKTQATLGDVDHNPYPAQAVVIVDARASGSQRQALQEFAHSQAGHLLDRVVRVDVAPINVEALAHGSVRVTAGKLARIETRSLCAADHLCGNEEVYYPPLVKLAQSMPAFTLREGFSGQGLGVVWDRQDTRSAFVGTFAL